MSFLKNANPVGAIADFRNVYQQAGKNRWWIALVSAAVTISIFSTLTGESWKKPRPLPEIVYITSWPQDRTEAETKAFIAENQKRKEEREALQRAYEAEGRKLWKAVGKASGMDVDAMEKQADAERAAAEAAEKARIEQLTGQSVEP